MDLLYIEVGLGKPALSTKGTFNSRATEKIMKYQSFKKRRIAEKSAKNL